MNSIQNLWISLGKNKFNTTTIIDYLINENLRRVLILIFFLS